MKTLIQKEVRLLLPAFAAALVLAVLPVWFLPVDPYYHEVDGSIAGYLFLFGIVLLALSSFGREISLRTVPFALAQPLERSRIWWTKVLVLAVLIGLTFNALLISDNLSSIFESARFVTSNELAVSGLAVIALTAGAVWLTLLLRQVVAALVLAVLIPLAASIVIETYGGAAWMSVAALAIYAVAGFFLAWRQFLRLQDTAWTGGMVSIGGSRAGAEQVALRGHTPWATLFRKELHLQQFTLVGMAALFVLHLGVILLRKLGTDVFSHTILSALEEFGMVWLFVPLLAGSQSVAEERQLGTLDPLLCLPVSRKVQFGVKLVSVLLIGGLLGAALFCAGEKIGGVMDFGASTYVMGIQVSNIVAATFVFMILSFIGFYGSTLTRGLVPALAVSIVLTILVWVFQMTVGRGLFLFGNQLWQVTWPPALLATVFWLAWGNFRWVFESGPRWRLNIIRPITVLVLVCGVTAGIYNRVWELAMPLEAARGPARLLSTAPPKIRVYGNQQATVLPDGRLRTQNPLYWGSTKRMWSRLESHFANGSNWVDAVPTHDQTVGIQSDGTLWVSTNALRFGEMVRFGSDVDWQGVRQLSPVSVILIKRDGTLWSWGPVQSNRTLWTWPSRGNYRLQSSLPQRLVAFDWARTISGPDEVYAWKMDGSAWVFHDSPGDDQNILPSSQVEVASGVEAVRVPALDHAYFRSIAFYPEGRGDSFGRVGVLDDGTLWYWDAAQVWPMSRQKALLQAREPELATLVQIGKDTNWTSVEAGYSQLLALKIDGSLWRWRFNSRRVGKYVGILPGALQISPVRLGTHYDWVSLPDRASAGDTVALAADGTMWRWPDPEYELRRDENTYRWLAASRKPVKLGNILDGP